MIKNIIKRGIGFNPGSVKYIPTYGFNISALIASVNEIFINDYYVRIPQLTVTNLKEPDLVNTGILSSRFIGVNII